MNDELQRYTRYGEKKAGTNNKFYEVEAVEREDGRGAWTYRWGRIGTTGQSKEGVTYSFEAAKRQCDEQFKSKQKRGYHEVTAMEALASAVEELDERKTNGLPPVDLPIPTFGAGKSEKRCQDYCRKWLGKLNLVRASKHDLGYDAFRKQLDSVFEGYRNEWYRMHETKAHGPNIKGDKAREAWQGFRDAMRENCGLRRYYCV
jgi:predicted DNA-binding WGR domain protein